MVRAGTLAAVALVLFGAACEHGIQEAHRDDRDSPSEYVWQLPEGFPVPLVPPDNPMTPEKVALGRQLFHDPRLSGDGTL